MHVRDEFLFLNRLRESGKVNMLGATPWIANAYGHSSKESKKVLTEWIQWVNEDPENLNK